MNLKTLSHLGPESFIIGAEYDRQWCGASYQCIAGPITAAPDIVFVDEKVHFLTLWSAATFPAELLVQEQNGAVYRYGLVGTGDGA